MCSVSARTATCAAAGAATRSREASARIAGAEAPRTHVPNPAPHACPVPAPCDAAITDPPRRRRAAARLVAAPSPPTAIEAVLRPRRSNTCGPRPRSARPACRRSAGRPTGRRSRRPCPARASRCGASSPSIRAPAIVSASSALSRDMPARTASAGAAQEEARVGDVVVGVEADEHAGLLEHRAGPEREVHRLELAARASITMIEHGTPARRSRRRPSSPR